RGARDVPVRVVVLPVEEREQVAARLDETRRDGRLAVHLDRRKQALRDFLRLVARKMLLDQGERRFGEAAEVVPGRGDHLRCLLDALLSVASVPYRDAGRAPVAECCGERIVTDDTHRSEHADQRARAVVPRGDEQVRLVRLAGYRPGVTWRVHFREQKDLPPFVQRAGYVVHGASLAYRGVKQGERVRVLYDPIRL